LHLVRSALIDPDSIAQKERKALEDSIAFGFHSLNGAYACLWLCLLWNARQDARWRCGTVNCFGVSGLKVMEAELRCHRRMLDFV
jgi:hypothetical protein